MSFTTKITNTMKTHKITIAGTGTIITLIAVLMTLSYYGVTVKTSGDITCAGTIQEPCISYINISTSNFSVVNPKTVFYFDDESKVNYTVYKLDTIGRWQKFNISGKTISANSFWQLKLVGYKQINETVKWAMGAGAVVADPVWKGYSSNDFFVKLVENQADLTQGYAVFDFYNPTIFDFNVSKELLKPFFQKYLGNDVKSWKIIINGTELGYYPVNKSYVEQVWISNISCYNIISPNGTVSQICQDLGWYENQTKYRIEYIQGDYPVKAKTVYDVELYGYWDAHLGLQSVEWFPDITVSGVTFRQMKWAWWNSSWQRKRGINITNSGSSALTNYQFVINITYDSDMASDFSDIRFVNGSENAELSHWLETKVNSQWAYFWVKVPSIPVGTNQNLIYVYYGNTSVVNSASNGTNAFVFYDDFSTNTTSNYVQVGATGISNITWDSTNGYLHCYGCSNARFKNTISLLLSEDLIIEGRYRGSNLDHHGSAFAYNASNWIHGTFCSANMILDVRIAGSETASQPAYTFSANTWYVDRVIWNRTQAHAYAYAYSDQILTNSSTSLVSTSLSANFGTTQLYSGVDLSGSSGTIEVDWIRTRKYATPEPTYSIGSEQTPSPPGGVVAIYLNGSSTDRKIETGEVLNITGTISSGTVCLSVNHTDLGTNFTCGTDSVTYMWNSVNSSTNKFNDGSTTKNISFIASKDMEDSHLCYPDSFNPNCTNGMDEDWNTYTIGLADLGNTINEYYDNIPGMVSANWTFKYQTYVKTGYYFSVQCENETFFNTIFLHTASYGNGTFTRTAEIPSACLNKYYGLTKIITGIRNISASEPTKYYEGKLDYALGNQTIYVRLHSNDLINKASINLTGVSTASPENYPTNVRIFVNDSLSNVISGKLKEGTSSINTFYDGISLKNMTFNRTGGQMTYLKLAKNAIVMDAKLNISAFPINYTFQFADSAVESSNGDWSTLSTDQPLNDYTATWSSAWKINGTESLLVYLNSGGTVSNYAYIETYNPNNVNMTDAGHVNVTIKPLNKNSAFDIEILYGPEFPLNSRTVLWSENLYDIPDAGENVTLDLIDVNSNSYKLFFRLKLNRADYFVAGSNIGFYLDWVRAIDSYSYPNDTYIDAEGNGTADWSYAGMLNESVSPQQTSNFSDSLNHYLSVCSSDSYGNCNIPLVFGTDAAGIIQISSINITYTIIYNPITLNADYLQNYLNKSAYGYVNIPIKIEANYGNVTSVGNITISGLKLSYNGSANFTATAFQLGNTTNNASQNINVYFSRFVRNLPYTFTNNVIFLPSNNNATNVTPYGQTNNIAIFNITWMNYDVNASLAIRINETTSCAFFRISNTSSWDNGFNLTTSFKQIYYNRQFNSSGTTNNWLWVNLYNCNATELKTFVKRFDLESCCIGCMACW